MSLSYPETLKGIVAASGDKNDIPSPAQAAGFASFAEGFGPINGLPLASGGIAPKREDINGFLNLLSQHNFYQQSGGMYTWANTLDYTVPSMVVGSDGAIYFALLESGPGTSAGYKDPTTQPTYWKSVGVNLGLLAPLASPALTGTPTAPTPDVGDNSTKLATTAFVISQLLNLVTQAQFDNSAKGATTAFVQRAIGSKSTLKFMASSGSLDASYVGALTVFSGSNTIAATLPATSGLPPGSAISIINATTNPATVAVSGTDEIYGNPTHQHMTSLTLGVGDQVTIISQRGVQWFVAGGSLAANETAVFGSVLANPGYQKLPGGLILQNGTWTASATPGAAVAVSFYSAFPTACLGVVVSAHNASTTNSAAWYDTPAVGGFNGRADVASLTCDYIAWGY